MSHERKRVAEIRLIVHVSVNPDHVDLIDAMAQAGGAPAHDIVRSEIASNLESVSYVESVTVFQPRIQGGFP